MSRDEVSSLISADELARERSVLVRVGHLFLIPWIRSHRMRRKPRAHMAIAYAHVILVMMAGTIALGLS